MPCDPDYDPSDDRFGFKRDALDDCFISTACYSADDSITKTLRLWRDKQKNIFSVLFIKAYYSGIGKAGAKILNKFPILKSPSRKAIKTFMWILRIS